MQNSTYQPDQIPPTVQFAEVQTATSVYLAFNEPLNTALLNTDAFRVLQARPQSIDIISDTTLMLRFPSNIEAEYLVTRGLQDYSGNQSDVRSHPLSYLPLSGEIIINEIMYEPLSDDFDALPNQPEYVELLNVSEKNLSLRDLALSGPINETGKADSLRSAISYPTLLPQHFALFFSNIPENLLIEAFPSQTSSESKSTLLPVSSSSLSLLNSGDFIQITHAGTVLDEVEFQPSWHYPQLASTRGIALERRIPLSSSSLASNWSSSIHPEGGTPGRLNSIYTEPQIRSPVSTVDIHPNPFTPNGDGVEDVLTITLHPETTPQSVRIEIFDSKGRFVRTLVQAGLASQQSIYAWDGTRDGQAPLPTGIYILLIHLQDSTLNLAQKIKKIAVLSRL